MNHFYEPKRWDRTNIYQSAQQDRRQWSSLKYWTPSRSQAAPDRSLGQDGHPLSSPALPGSVKAEPEATAPSAIHYDPPIGLQSPPYNSYFQQSMKHFLWLSLPESVEKVQSDSPAPYSLGEYFSFILLHFCRALTCLPGASNKLFKL